jgi:hypothetical protein
VEGRQWRRHIATMLWRGKAVAARRAWAAEFDGAAGKMSTEGGKDGDALRRRRPHAGSRGPATVRELDLGLFWAQSWVRRAITMDGIDGVLV